MRFLHTQTILLFFFLFATSIFVQCNCSKSNNGDDSKEESALIELITFGRYWEGIERGMNQTLIKEFREQNGINIKMRTFGKSPDVLNALRIATEQERGVADFLWIDLMDVPAYERSDLLMDLSDIVDPYRDKIPQAFLDAATTSDGKLIGVPHHISADIMLYNANKISEEELPDTYEELLEWCKKNPDRYSYRGNSEALAASLIDFLYAFGAMSSEKDPAKLFDIETNPEIIEVFEYLRELYPYIHEPYNDTPLILTDMAAESIWLIANWDSELLRIRVDKGADYIRLHPNVQLKGKSGMRPICSGGWLFAIPKASPHPEEAKKFIEFVMTIEMQKKAIWNNETGKSYTGHIPIRADAVAAMDDSLKALLWDIHDVNKLMQIMSENFANRPKVSYYHDLSSLLQQAHNDIVLNKADVISTLNRAQKQLNYFVVAAEKNNSP